MSGDNTNEISIEDDAELLALEQLLAADDEPKSLQEATVPPEEAKRGPPRLREDSTFAEAFSYEVELPQSKIQEMVSKVAAARAEELDSSDDEEVKNFLERKYNEYGSDINKRLKQEKAAKHEGQVAREVNAALSAQDTNSPSSSCHIKNPHNPVKRQSFVATSNSFQKKIVTVPPPTLSFPTATSTTFTDPVFGMRIIKPLVSSALLVERMAGRKAVPFSNIAIHIQHGDLNQDWVIAGALVHKNAVRTTKKGDAYSIWRLSDLRGEIKTVSLFLFRSAHKDLWKTAEGMCVAVLNPTIFEKRAESGDTACLSIDTAQKIMVLGQSKDMGMCKAKKRNGEACTKLVNLGDCDYCIYHMQQEFGKMSRRSELQSATAGRGLQDLRNKVLGKSEVFYGGQSFSAVPAKRSAKLMSKDKQRIGTLSEYAISPFSSSVNHTSKPRTAASEIPYAARDGCVSKLAGNVEVGVKQRLKDLERLQILQAESNKKQSTEQVIDQAKTPKAKESHNNTASLTPKPQQPNITATTTNSSPLPLLNAVPEKFKDREFSFSRSPQLSSENFCIEVNIGNRRADAAKQKAMQVLKKRPIEKINPNSVRGSKEGKRRLIDDLNEKFTSTGAKRQKMEDEQREQDRKTRLQRIMDATSSHTNLVDIREKQEQDKYFNKLEKKESLEEKMLSTYKMPCKAVICLKCKYTAFSAAERCKQEQHPLKVVDAEKRFFQCKDCGNRTATVFKLPKVSCKTCKGSRWERTAMIRERKVCDGTEGLSVRGDEETFIGSLAGKASLNLLVPDE